MGDHYDILCAQRSLQRLYEETDPSCSLYECGEELITLGAMRECFRFNKEAQDREHWEILDLLPWKAWRKAHRDVARRAVPQTMRVEIKQELVDELHFFLNKCIAAGYADWEEVERAYALKNAENRDRATGGY